MQRKGRGRRLNYRRSNPNEICNGLTINEDVTLGSSVSLFVVDVVVIVVFELLLLCTFSLFVVIFRKRAPFARWVRVSDKRDR